MKGFSWELGIGAKRPKSLNDWLPDGRKSFNIGLVVLIQYQLWQDRHPPSHVAVAKTPLTTLHG